MDIMEVSMMHHVGIVLMVLWLLSLFNRCHPVAFFLSLIYLFLVHERYVMRLRKKLRYEERRKAHQKRMLSDSETVVWLNHAMEKIWPVCMEQVVSQKILLPIIPWFLDKYKPWTVKKAVVQHMYLGRNPPLFTAIRVLRHGTGDDHLVLELGMSLCTADDMSAILAVQLSKRLGFGMWTKLHITRMHVEGKVLVGVKFLRNWPFLGRLRVCFVEPPYFQMTVKPIFTHGLDVTEVPGIAGWLDNLLLIAFEQTLVQPNMLVVDVEKFVSPGQEDWFSVDEKEPIAYAIVEVVEASDMKPSDLNGLADPYVKVQLGPHKFRTKIQKRTLSPKWVEEFMIPISTWESPNVLAIEVRDKDPMFDDNLGECTVNINGLRDGERHDMWLNLENIKMGRLHLAITVLEETAKDENNAVNGETWNKEETQDAAASETRNRASVPSESSGKSQKVADNLEPIDIEGQEKTGIWVYHPGSEVSQTWEPRKGKSRRLDDNVHGVPGDSFSSTNLRASGAIGGENSSSDESLGGKKRKNIVQKGLHKIGSAFHRNPKNVDELNNVVDVQSPYANIKSVGQKEIGVKLIVEDGLPGPTSVKDLKEMNSSPEVTCSENPGKVKGMAKNILKQARSIKHALSRKGSNKSRSGLSQSTERDIGLESDSSADESPTSPKDRRVPAALSPIMSSSALDDLEETKQNIAQTGLTEVAIKTEVSGAEDEVSGTNTSGNGVEEPAESVPAKGKLEEEK